MVDIFAGIVVFDYLILHDAHAGLLNRQLRQPDPGFIGSRSRSQKNLIHLLLREL